MSFLKNTLSKISLLNIICEKLFNLPPQTLMSWNEWPLPLLIMLGVHCLAYPNELTGHLYPTEWA
jgi:hypothetical protein